MKNLVGLIALLAACTACMHAAPITDPHVAGVDAQQWVGVVPRSQGATFDVAMRVLSDSVYPIADARKDAGTIKTGERRPSDVQRGMQQVVSMLRFNTPVRLNLLILPVAADSSRVVITGEYAIMDKWDRINARDKKSWPFMDGIGQAILAASR